MCCVAGDRDDVIPIRFLRFLGTAAGGGIDFVHKSISTYAMPISSDQIFAPDSALRERKEFCQSTRQDQKQDGDSDNEGNDDDDM